KMGEKSTFFAVGAGHLAGQKGVLNLLKEAGYTLSPVN
ncbi:MAG TPA: TraB/GumN family protein, partial [Algoriphagus sp.]|nr:TraB/GumN family protein [Algoriphagus sp.]